jgi:methionine aminopeptidase
VDLGAHFDGYIVSAASSIVVQADGSQVVEDRKADVINAAYNALQAGLRTIKVGNTNT